MSLNSQYLESLDRDCVREIICGINANRLAAYREATASDVEALFLYQLSARLSCLLLETVGGFEIVQSSSGPSAGSGVRAGSASRPRQPRPSTTFCPPCCRTCWRRLCASGSSSSARPARRSPSTARTCAEARGRYRERTADDGGRRRARQRPSPRAGAGRLENQRDQGRAPAVAGSRPEGTGGHPRRPARAACLLAR